VTVLGATGSIGRQTLDVLAEASDRLELAALGAGRDLDGLCELAARLRPPALALEAAADPQQARTRLAEAAPGSAIHVGRGSTEKLAREVDSAILVNGVVGAAGLGPTLAALERGARVALANKETLVVGGPLVRRALERGGELVPVDSEHSAVWQCLGGRPAEEVRRLTLTASGGALRSHPDWRRASISEVLAHPVWSMGRRITVDSALLVNKGLELIEAHWLFDVPWDRLEAVLHPQALVHAMVTFRDGSMLMQAAPPDMRLPIRLACSWPEHWEAPLESLSPATLSSLEFSPIDAASHPGFRLAVDAGRTGGVAPCVFNAADEVAVEAFLDGMIPLGGVPEVVEQVLASIPAAPVESLAQLRDVDAAARARARELLAARSAS
jgi:1-deoxy-D-xylulose-5-phosphate reductoisomerase